MDIRLRALTCGWLTGPLGSFLEGASGAIRVPVPCYLVEHPRGKVLFDTGLHPDAVRDPSGRLGIAARIFRAELDDGATVGARLAAIGCAPAAIDFVVNSHLHFDHTGGNAEIANAVFLHQRDEWAAGREPDQIAANVYNPADYDLGHALRLLDGEHDLFGDGSVVCIPTPGHTPGHQSLRLRVAGGEVVLTGDACYLRRSLDETLLPPLVHDRAKSLRSLEILRALRARGATLLYGHDPEAWAAVPQAPADFLLPPR
jgi:glyoxylase-like metal-dependent hydrolase (beta-lactamase superfamily II)